MTLPFPLPDWLPWWAALAVLVLALLYLLVFLVMPFSVFGLKGRLDQIQEQLDELHGEIRRIAPRGQAAPSHAATETTPAFGRAVPPPPAPRPPEPPREDRRPPSVNAPPPPRVDPLIPARRRQPETEDQPRRVEPRLDWSRE